MTPRTALTLCILAATTVTVAAPPADAPTTRSDPDALVVRSAEMIVLHVPFYCDRVRRHMHRANTHGERVLVYRVTLGDGTVGYGESPMNDSARMDRIVGRNALGLLDDDRIGMGPQMALYDAVGKSMDLPAHKLLGRQVRKRVPIAWWAIDMPAEDWAAEIAESARRGYTSIKLKARPWRDIHQQIATISEAAPADYTFAIDFNGFLLNAENALTHLKRLDPNPHVAIYESPFYLDKDIAGARRLCENLEKLVVEHFREKVYHADAWDGCLIAANYRRATRTREMDALCRSVDRPYWLQMVGTGITTAWMAQIGAVCTHASLPAVTCHELYEDDLLKERLEVVKGHIAVSDRPGLGVEIDEAAIERYRVKEVDVPTPQELARAKPGMVRITIPAGAHGPRQVLEFDWTADYYHEFLRGEHPGFVPDTEFEVIRGRAVDNADVDADEAPGDR